MKPKNFNRVRTLDDLALACELKLSVVVPNVFNWAGRKPAAFMINLPGSLLVRLFRYGMFIYVPKGGSQ